MILNHIQIEGIGPHEVTGFDLKPGINLIMGPNGSGKTMLIEAIPACIWGRMPSRSGSLFRFCTTDKSSIWLSIENRGILREQKVIFQDTTLSENTNVLITNTTDIERFIKTNSQEGVIDGEVYKKITEFETQTKMIFGELEYYLTAFHFSQKGSKDLTLMDPRERKEFFRQILNLEYMEEILETFKDKSRANEQARQLLEHVIWKLGEDIKKLSGENDPGEYLRSLYDKISTWQSYPDKTPDLQNALADTLNQIARIKSGESPYPKEEERRFQQLKSRVNTADSEINRISGLLRPFPDIQNVSGLTAQIESERLKLEPLDRTISELDESRQATEHLKTVNTMAIRQFEKLLDKAKNIPCGDTFRGKCPYLADVPTVEKQTEQWSVMRNNDRGYHEKIQQLENKLKDHKQTRSQIQALIGSLGSQVRSAGDRQELKTKLSGLESERNLLAIDLKELTEEVENKKALHLKSQNTELLKPLDEKIIEIKQQIESEKHKVLADALELKRLKDERDWLEKMILELETNRAELGKNQERQQMLNLILECFGAKGAQALIMEHTLPKISGIANRLMMEAGFTHQVRFNTQKELKDATQRESLEIEISIDNHDFRPIEDLSGGEEHIIATALRIALAVYLREQLDSKIEFLVFDEAFDSLQMENVQRIIELFKASLKYFPQIIITTHSPIVVDEGNVILINGKDKHEN